MRLHFCCRALDAKTKQRRCCGGPPKLHWLPVRRRVDFKMVTLVYFSLPRMALTYLAADCQLICDEGRL